MAKGDNKKAQTQIDTQGQIAQNSQNALTKTLYPQQNQMYNNYLYGTGTNLNDYNSIMRNFQGFYQNPWGGGGGMGNQGGGAGGGKGSQYNNAPGANYQQGNTGQGMTQPQGGGDYQSIVRNMMGSGPITYESIKAMEPQLQQHGMSLVHNARGTSADIRLPNGQLVDFVQNMDDPNPANRQFAWQVDPDAGGGGGMQSIFGGGPFGPALSQALSGYSDFARTGGFSPQNIQDLRARAVSPIRSMYGRAQSELGRSQRLTGGGANYAPAAAKMAREQAYTTGDMLQNSEANLAQMVQGGRLAGLGGLSQMGLTGSGQEMQGRLGALSGMAGLYGTTPGLANMFGQQVLGGQQNLINAQQLQNQLGLGLIGSQINKGQIPGDFSQAMGNIGSVLGLAGKIGGGMTGGLGGSKGSNVPGLMAYQGAPQGAFSGTPINLGYGG